MGDDNMEFPQSLSKALESQVTGIKNSQIMKDAQTLSERYRFKSGKGERLLTSNEEAVAYAASRMPATFGAVSMALENTLSSAGYYPKTLMDVGAGTGAASWAADALIDLESITCLEREEAMCRLGQTLMEQGHDVIQNAKWIQLDLTKDEIPGQADLIIASYVLNEMTAESQLKTIKKLWKCANNILLLVEPGTPAGFANLNGARRMLLESGAHIAAPCPHEDDCPITQNDWCHFTCRVNRSRLHRELKGGEAPYEDEKFTYMAFTREKCQNKGARVLRHPQIRSGHVMLEVCSREGIKSIKLSKKDGEIYKCARKAKSGDAIF